MNAYIKVWGRKYLLQAVTWHTDGKYAHVTFFDENEKCRSIFHKRNDNDLDAEGNRDFDGIIHADLDKVIVWKDKNSRATNTTKESNISQ